MFDEHDIGLVGFVLTEQQGFAVRRERQAAERRSWFFVKEPATLSAIRALLGHPDLHKPGSLVHLGVDHVLTAKRISVGKFMNFARARIFDS